MSFVDWNLLQHQAWGMQFAEHEKPQPKAAPLRRITPDLLAAMRAQQTPPRRTTMCIAVTYACAEIGYRWRAGVA
jgi:hypothetical protein